MFGFEVYIAIADPRRGHFNKGFYADIDLIAGFSFRSIPTNLPQKNTCSNHLFHIPHFFNCH